MATAHVVIDKRERALARLLRDAEQQTLDVGDIKCTYENGGAWIVERKTAQDLAASIRDGRWAEQKDRLLYCGCKAFYVVEGI